MTDIHHDDQVENHEHHTGDAGSNAVLWMVSVIILVAIVVWLVTAMGDRTDTTPTESNTTTIEIPGAGAGTGTTNPETTPAEPTPTQP